MDKTGAVMSSGIREQFDHFRSYLFPYAYNIIGDVMEAEDIVQTLLNQYFLEDRQHVENPSAYLVRSVINRSINEKKALRRQLETYPGKWLPTPVLTEELIYSNADREKILNYSLLVLLDQLGAKERAVFILKETFDVPHDEIAAILNIDQVHSRQLLKRSKEKISTKLRKPNIGREQETLLNQLVHAITTADVEATKRLLAEDVLSISDGGPSRGAARKTLEGFDRVFKFLKAIFGKYFPEGTSTTYCYVNHSPALVFKKDNEVFRCMIFEIEDGMVKDIFIVVNPDKLLTISSNLVNRD